MTSHWRYLGYVARHKFWVLVFGIPLKVPFWRLVVHDASKFSRAEWGAYVRKFYGGASPRDATGGYDPDAQGAAFKAAWKHHWESNAHHWNHWAEGLLSPLPMPETYAREMVADWFGAGMAQGKPDVVGFYRANGPKMKLHPETRALVERLLGIAS